LFSQFQNLAPIVVTIHATVKGMRTNIADQKNLQSETEKYMNLFSRIIEQGEKISFRKSDYFFPVSRFTLEQIKKLYHLDILQKSSIVYNATDTSLFKPMENDQLHKPVITFIGRFYAVKGFNLFIEALLNLKSQGYDFIPYLVGRGHKEEIHALLKKHFKEFIIKDFVPYRQINKIYNQSDIVVVPSLYENFPGVILEAMSSGKIVIASNVGGIPEIIENEDNGFLFEKNDILDLSNQIKKVLDETVNKKNIQFNARNTICERFDWSNQADIINNIYRRYI
jgi:glycosyltransferase involved in cell wall biosynthesis